MIEAKRIGLFGGSFDPPHKGHIALVIAGLELGLDEVWVIPALPVHRKLSGSADGRTRLGWLQTVFANLPNVKVLDWEVSRKEPTPAIDTLCRFNHEYPGLTPWLMLGLDAWAGFESWREYPKHRELCNVMVFARQGLDLAALPAHAGWQKLTLESWKNCNKTAHWCYAEVELPEISATLIRSSAKQGSSLTDLVPASLCSVIEKKYAVMKENM